MVPGLLALDLDVDAGRKVELHQRVEGLLSRLDDVEKTLVSPDLELLARLLVDVGPPQHRVATDLGGQRDGSRDVGAGPLRRLDDIACRLVEQLVVEGFEANPDLRCISHGALPTRGSW